MEQNQQLKMATDDYLLHILDGLPSEDELASRLSFSAAFKRRMRRLLRKARKMEAASRTVDFADPADPKNRSLSLKRKRLVLVAIILSIFASVLSISSAREAVFGFFIRIYDSFTEIIFNRNIDEQPETTAVLPTSSENDAAMVPTLLPEGYQKTDQLEAGGTLQIIYTNPAGDELIYERQISDTRQLIIDTEGVQIDEIQINNIKGFFYTKKNVQNLVWQEGPYIFMIYGKITKEELLNIAESINR